jgi:hypothetical protein
MAGEASGQRAGEAKRLAAIGNSANICYRSKQQGYSRLKVPQCRSRGCCMKTIITFGPAEIKVLTAAFEDALRALQLADRADPLSNTIAKRIIDLARLGERDPVRLREYALEINHRD